MTMTTFGPPAAGADPASRRCDVVGAVARGEGYPIRRDAGGAAARHRVDIVRTVTRMCDHGRLARHEPRRQRMFERLFGSRDMDPAIAERIPPGQYKTDKFPVLHYGSVPQTDLATWDFKVFGEVDSPFTLTWDAVQGAAAQDGPHRHPLRDPLDEARHRLGGRPDPGDPRARPGPPDARPTSSPTPSRATRRTCR